MKESSEVLGVKIVGGLREKSTPWGGASLLIELFRRAGVDGGGGGGGSAGAFGTPGQEAIGALQKGGRGSLGAWEPRQKSIQQAR